MHFVIKFILIFYIVNIVCCDQLKIDAEDDVNLVTGCVAVCLEKNQTKNTLANCYEECSLANRTNLIWNEFNGSRR